MRLIATATLWALSGTAVLAWGPLMETGEVIAEAAPGGVSEVASGEWTGNGVTVLDIRGAGDFAAGHIPGAANTPYGAYRGPQDNPGRVPGIDALEVTLEGAGAAMSDKILVVHQGKNATDFGAAARVYWTLKSAGYQEISVLNGGFEEWVAQGLPMAQGASSATPVELSLTWSDDWMIDSDGVADVVAGRSEAVLVDARPHEFFTGEQKHGAAAEAGTLLGALNITHTTWFGGGTPKVDAPQSKIEEIKALAGASGDAPLVSFCNTGHWAATNWFAASELAGIEGVKLYPESMVGWTGLGNAVFNGN